MNEYELAWQMLEKEILTKNSWGKIEIQNLMLIILNKSQRIVIDNIRNPTSEEIIND